MKKLENYGVLEMDTVEMRETEGGSSPLWYAYLTNKAAELFNYGYCIREAVAKCDC